MGKEVRKKQRIEGEVLELSKIMGIAWIGNECRMLELLEAWEPLHN